MEECWKWKLRVQIIYKKCLAIPRVQENNMVVLKIVKYLGHKTVTCDMIRISAVVAQRSALL